MKEEHTYITLEQMQNTLKQVLKEKTEYVPIRLKQVQNTLEQLKTEYVPITLEQMQVFSEQLNKSSCVSELSKFFNLKEHQIPDLSGLDLSKLNLSGANLSGSKLCYVNFGRSNLTRATLIGADVSFANFTGAKLEGASFSGAKTTGTIFIALRDTNLKYFRYNNTLTLKDSICTTKQLLNNVKDKNVEAPYNYQQALHYLIKYTKKKEQKKQQIQTYIEAANSIGEMFTPTTKSEMYATLAMVETDTKRANEYRQLGKSFKNEKCTEFELRIFKQQYETCLKNRKENQPAIRWVGIKCIGGGYQDQLIVRLKEIPWVQKLNKLQMTNNNQNLK